MSCIEGLFQQLNNLLINLVLLVFAVLFNYAHILNTIQFKNCFSKLEYIIQCQKS